MTKEKAGREEDLKRKRARRYAELLGASPALDAATPVWSARPAARTAGASRRAEPGSMAPRLEGGSFPASLGIRRDDERRSQGMLSTLLTREAGAPEGAPGPQVAPLDDSAGAPFGLGAQAPAPSPLVTVHDPQAGLEVTYDRRGGAPEVDLRQVRQQMGSGAPLDEGTRAYMEWRFGRSFESVRVHTGPKGDALSKALSAHAFALGADVAFQADAFRPGTQEGDRLLAHELTHVVQSGLAPALPAAVATRADPAAGLHKSTSVSEPTDRFEIEADAMADKVVAEGRAEFQRHLREQAAAEEEEAARRRAGGAADKVDASMQGGGAALEPRLREKLEGYFEQDLGAVRVHTGAQAAQAAAAVQAHAFAVGTDIVFGGGEYRPGNPEGDALIAHEVTHVVQHLEGRAGRASQVVDGVPVTTPTDAVEREAYAVEAEVRRGALSSLPVTATLAAQPGPAAVAAALIPLAALPAFDSARERLTPAIATAALAAALGGAMPLIATYQAASPDPAIGRVGLVAVLLHVALVAGVLPGHLWTLGLARHAATPALAAAIGFGTLAAQASVGASLSAYPWLLAVAGARPLVVAICVAALTVASLGLLGELDSARSVLLLGQLPAVAAWLVLAAGGAEELAATLLFDRAFAVAAALLAVDALARSPIARRAPRRQRLLRPTVLALAVAIASLIGLPPTTGFAARWPALQHLAIERPDLVAVLLAAAAVSIVGARRIAIGLVLAPIERPADPAPSPSARASVGPLLYGGASLGLGLLWLALAGSAP